MKLTVASALLAIAGSASAFSAAPSASGSGSALRSTPTATETYTFTKSEEIFAEAKEVSSSCLRAPRGGTREGMTRSIASSDRGPD